MARKRTSGPENSSSGHGANLGFEAQLWRAADALRGSMDAAEYKHVVLGLVFLKYISDAFEEHHAQLEAERAEGADPEDPDEYRAQNVFWVPPEARWAQLQAQAKQPTIGEVVDKAMEAVERDNPSLKEVLPKDYARLALDKQRLGQLIDLVTRVRVGTASARSKDVLGRVYEYFFSQFASAEGKKGGEFYTPRCVVRLLVEMLEPFRGRVYDPCCGSGGMFVQSVEFIEAHATGNGNGGRRGGSRTRPMRDRRGYVLFIDARKMGRMVDRTHRELTDEDIARIANTYHAWRADAVRGRPPCLPRCGDHNGSPLRRRARFLQKRHAGRDSQARLLPHPRPLRGRGGTAGRRGALRGECSDWLPNCTNSKPRPLGLMRRSGRTLRSLDMTLSELLQEKREEILRICAKYGAQNVRVFGSVARGEADERSDLDFLVEMEPGRSLFDLGGLQYELEQLLGCPVDVVTDRGLKARIRDRVRREALPL